MIDEIVEAHGEIVELTRVTTAVFTDGGDLDEDASTLETVEIKAIVSQPSQREEQGLAGRAASETLRMTVKTTVDIQADRLGRADRVKLRRETLYDHGRRAALWEPGFSSGTGSQAKEADHLRLDAGSGTAPIVGERTYVTTEKVDLTDIEKIEVDWANNGIGTVGSHHVDLCVSTNKAGAANSFTKRLQHLNPFSRTKETLDVSDIKGKYHIRIHAVDASGTSGTGPALLDVFSVRLYTEEIYRVAAVGMDRHPFAEVEKKTVQLEILPGR